MENVSKVMVCVTRQKTCERLIKIGKKVATELQADLSVVHVAKNGVNFLGNPDEGEALDYLFSVSKESDAEMTVLRSDNEVSTLVEFARKNNITEIVVGQSPDLNNRTNIIKEMQSQLPHIRFRIVPS